MVSSLQKSWSQEWKQYGTCSLSSLDQHAYFQAALKLTDKIDLLKILQSAGIKPGATYSLSAIKSALKKGTGFETAIQCNRDKDEKGQIYLVHLCTDSTGSKFIKCPKLPNRKCDDPVKFPAY